MLSECRVSALFAVYNMVPAYFVIFPVLLHFILVSGQGPRVSLSMGEIEGKFVTTSNNNTAKVFLQVPYAQAPIGDLRFRNPVPKQAWKGVLSCKVYGPACMSNTSQTTSPQSYVSEDCLHVNVFAGVECGVELCPVIYYIHGGGFYYDAATMFPEDILVDNFGSNGVVFVTVGYRLGAFGLFWTNSTDATGNYGMFDLLHGLDWVQREIRNFGGDPNRVTLMGHSSGAATASLLSLAPGTDELFHQVLVMSGSSQIGGISSDGAKLDFSYKTDASRALAIYVGCATEAQWDQGQFSQIVECMRALDGDYLLANQRELETTVQFGGPMLDPRIWPDNPINLAKTRRAMPMMIGSTRNEYPWGKLKVPVDSGPDYLYGPCVEANNYLMAPSVATEIIAKECIKKYAKQYGTDIPNAVSNMTSDIEVYIPVYRDATSMRDREGTVYLYSFDYVRPGMEGFFPAHAQDLTYVMGIHPFPFTEADRKIQRLYNSLIVQFAKTGKPREQWEALASPQGFNYYSINPEPENKPFYHYNEIEFWDTVAPALAEGALWAEEHAEIQPTQTTEQTTDWETGFWAVFCVLVVLVILCVLFLTLRCCRRMKRNNGQPRDDTTDESTGLLSTDTENSKGRNRMRHYT